MLAHEIHPKEMLLAPEWQRFDRFTVRRRSSSPMENEVSAKCNAAGTWIHRISLWGELVCEEIGPIIDFVHGVLGSPCLRLVSCS